MHDTRDEVEGIWINREMVLQQTINLLKSHAVQGSHLSISKLTSKLSANFLK